MKSLEDIRRARQIWSDTGYSRGLLVKNTSPKACSGNAPLKRFPAEKKRQGREKQAKAQASIRGGSIWVCLSQPSELGVLPCPLGLQGLSVLQCGPLLLLGKDRGLMSAHGPVWTISKPPIHPSPPSLPGLLEALSLGPNPEDLWYG
ncbi:unnamed protein product [Arctogadus glacialis]